MKYVVRWNRSAERELAEIWVAAANRNAVTSAAREVDRLLRFQPGEQGESRSDGFRVMIVEPLTVFFHVNESDRVVSVVRVVLPD
jgi:plasmid stabilization system protein ParE